MGFFGTLAGALGGLGGILAPFNPGLAAGLTLIGQVGAAIEDKDPDFKLDPNPFQGPSFYARYGPLWGVRVGTKDFGVLSTDGLDRVPQKDRFPWRFARIKVSELETVIKRVKSAQATVAAAGGPDFGGISGAGSGVLRPEDEKGIRPTLSLSKWKKVVYFAISQHPHVPHGKMYTPYPENVPDAVGKAYRGKYTSSAVVKDWFDDHSSVKDLLREDWQHRHDVADALDQDELDAWGAYAVKLAEDKARDELVQAAAAQAAADFNAKLLAIQNGTYADPSIGTLPPLVLEGVPLAQVELTTPSPKPVKVETVVVASAGLGGLLLLLL